MLAEAAKKRRDSVTIKCLRNDCCFGLLYVSDAFDAIRYAESNVKSCKPFTIYFLTRERYSFMDIAYGIQTLTRCEWRGQKYLVTLHKVDVSKMHPIVYTLKTMMFTFCL